jgi:MFS family permease
MSRFAAFHHPNFRRYFAGQVISSVGSWLQAFAVTWLVLDITERSDRLGVAIALQFLPLLLLGAPAGVLADRVDNRRLLIVTSVLSALVALLFGVVVSSGTPSLGAIYGLTFVSGLILAVERPAMQALLFQLVGRETLPSAVAANSTIVSVSRLVGPALGGAMIAVTGVASCFYANAISYVAVVVALVAVDRLVPRPLTARSDGNIRAAVTYVRRRPEVRRPLVVMAVIGLVVLNFPTTFPSMVRFGFDLGPGAVGTAMSVSAIGSILGGIYAAGLTPDPRRTLALVLVAFGAVLVAFTLAPTYPTFVLLSIPLGFASACFQSVDAVAVQQATEPSMQGRVMALHQMAWFGSTPIGALATGAVIQVTSPRVPFALGAIAAFACAVAVARVIRGPEGGAADPKVVVCPRGADRADARGAGTGAAVVADRRARRAAGSSATQPG